MMARARQIAAGVFVFGAALALGSQVVFPGFSGSTAATGNTFHAGTVVLVDNDADGPVLSLNDARPGSSATGCIRVRFDGTVDASVRLFGTVTGALGPFMQLKVERGTPATAAFPSCGGFAVDTQNYRGLGPGVLYTGALSAYPSSAATAIADPSAIWSNGSSKGYRFTVTLSDDPEAQGRSSTFTMQWLATNR